jgi:hypothetical protein
MGLWAPKAGHMADLSSESAAQIKIERNRDPRVLAPRRHD